jgi:Zn-dependent M16 (insulinase) family peptidase
MLLVFLNFVDVSTASGCLTEVHHINGEGKDAGVVYSEMQARQNLSGDLMELATQRLMFPKTSGYRSETGGLMEALRVLDVQTIREYASYLIVLT